SNTTPESPLQPCSSTFKLSMGLPCAHIIQRLLKSGQCLQLIDFYQHWWEEYSQQFNSLTLYQKNAALDKIPSLFQESTTTIQDLQLVMGKHRKCGICRETGHNSRMCPNAESMYDSDSS
ncbi:24002_t:CDS:2, partial [Gigaspora margarita]